MSSEGPPRRQRSIGPLHLFLLVPWVGLIVAARAPLRDNSFLWHIRAGELQLDAGRVLTADPFSFTRFGETWRTQSWLADLVYRQLELWTDLEFVPWLVAGVGSVALGLITVEAWRRSHSLAASAVSVILTGWIGIGFFSPRPVLFSYAFIALAVVVLGDRRLRWAIPLVVWVWAALHASFVVGLGLIVLTGLQRRRPWKAVLGVSVVAASLTAHGLGVWSTLLAFSSNRGALDLISEWAPPDLTGLDLVPYALFLALIVVGASTGSIAPRDLWVVIPIALFGLTAARAVFPAALVLCPFVAVTLARWTRGLEAKSRGTALPVTVAAGLLILGIPFLVRPAWEGLSEERFPVELAQELDDSPVFHDDVVGGYLIYAAGPERLVAVDDRAELYGVEGFTAVIRARRAHRSWRATFDDWNIGQALLEVDDGLVTLLLGEGWATVAEDDHFVLLRHP